MSLKDELAKWNTGVKYFDAGDYDTALDYFESIPDTSKISYNMGMSFLQIDQIESAIRAFGSSIQKDPYLSLAYFQRGACYYRIRKYEDALNDYDIALEKMRGVRLIDYTQLGLPYKLYSSYVQLNRGLTFMKLGNISLGMEDLQDAIRDKPKDSKDESDRIDQAMKLGQRAAEKLRVLEVPHQLIYKPPASKVENSEQVDYLGSSKVVAAIEATDNFTGFSGKRLKATTLDRATRGPLDDGSQTSMQRSATYSASRSKAPDNVRTSERSTFSNGSSETLIARAKTVDVTSTASRSNGSSSAVQSSREMTSYETSTTQSWTMNRGDRTSPEQDSSLFKPRKQSLAGMSGIADSSVYGQRRPSINSRPSVEVSLGRNHSRSIDSPSDASSVSDKIKLKCHFNEDTFLMLIPPNIIFYELASRIQKKFGTPQPLRLRYVDEDGEKVLMTDQEDMELAFRVYDIPIHGNGSNSAGRDMKLEVWCSNE